MSEEKEQVPSDPTILTEDGQKNLLLLELIVRLSALENILVKKEIVSKEEIIAEVQLLSEKAAEMTRQNDTPKQ